MYSIREAILKCAGIANAATQLLIQTGSTLIKERYYG
jgi:hypothetical protein